MSVIINIQNIHNMASGHQLHALPDSRWSSSEAESDSDSDSDYEPPDKTDTSNSMASNSDLESYNVSVSSEQTQLDTSNSPEEPERKPTTIIKVTLTPDEYKEHLATSDEDIMPAIRLIGDSIAQQHQIAGRAIIHSLPFISSVLLTLCTLVLVTEYTSMDRISMSLSYMAILAASLKAVEYFTAGYLDATRRSGVWLLTAKSETSPPPSDGPRAMIWVAKWKGNVVGTIILHCASEKEKRAFIRAWTVKLPYRGIGIGRSLLQLAIQECHLKGWERPEFAPDHANSLRVLPGMFSRGLDEMERKARSMLEREVESDDGMRCNVMG